MIVLDTNVWSEPLRPEPSTKVLDWMLEVSGQSVLTSISAAEMFYGAHRLPPGKRQTGLLSSIERLVDDAAGRILHFDLPAARHYGQLRAEAAQAGRSVSEQDAMIAAICRAHSHPLATRNTDDFQGLRIELINPWH